MIFRNVVWMRKGVHFQHSYQKKKLPDQVVNMPKQNKQWERANVEHEPFRLRSTQCTEESGRHADISYAIRGQCLNNYHN